MTKAEKAVLVAKEEFSKNIREPKGKMASPEIDKYIRSEDGLYWTWEKPYESNRQFEWCGAFAAFCYGKNGLKKEIRKEHLPSTYRLYSWLHSKAGKGREVKPKDILPGDVVVVKPQEGGKRYGNHICLAVDVQEDGIVTIEGNATGNFPDETRGEGVITTKRPFSSKNKKEYCVFYGIRFRDDDFE